VSATREEKRMSPRAKLLYLYLRGLLTLAEYDAECLALAREGE